MLTTLFEVLFGVAVLLVALVAIYWLTRFLPGRWGERGRIGIFLVPGLFVILIGLLVPALRTIYISFFNDAPRHKKFIGLRQYKEIFTGKDTRQVLFNSLTWVIVGTVATTVIAIAIARYADGIKGEKVAKSLIFIPGAISLAGAGIIWRFVYAGPPFEVGLLNQVTKAIPGLPSSAGGDGQRLWLLERGFGGFSPPTSAPGFNTFLMIVIFIWAQTGIATVILSAAIKGVPDTLIEAAKVDGATNRQTFYKVTLPYIRATIVTVATLTTIAGLKSYDIVAASTGGNFGTSTIANDFYNFVFLFDREGLGSAFAVLLFLLVIPVVVINRRSQRRAEELMGV